MYPYEIIAKIIRALYPLRPLWVIPVAWAIVSGLITIF